MSEIILLGRGHQIIEVPQEMWQGHLSQATEHTKQRLRFMTEDHHKVRNFVVMELPRQGVPISPDVISRALNLPLRNIGTILEDLERNLFFLVRNDRGAVNWAFPCTSELTPHRLKFSTGETIFAA